MPKFVSVEKAKTRKPKTTSRRRPLTDLQKRIYGDAENPQRVREFEREYREWVRNQREIENSWLRIIG